MSVDSISSKIETPPLIKKIAFTQAISGVAFLILGGLLVTSVFYPNIALLNKNVVIISSCMACLLGVAGIFLAVVSKEKSQKEDLFKEFSDLFDRIYSIKDPKKQAIVDKVCLIGGILVVLIGASLIATVYLPQMQAYVIPGKVLATAALATAAVTTFILFFRIKSEGKRQVEQAILKKLPSKLFNDLLIELKKMKAQEIENLDQEYQLKENKRGKYLEQKNLLEDYYRIVFMELYFFKKELEELCNREGATFKQFQKKCEEFEFGKTFKTKKDWQDYRDQSKEVRKKYVDKITLEQFKARLEICVNAEAEYASPFHAHERIDSTKAEDFQKLRINRFENLQSLYALLVLFNDQGSDLEKIHEDLRNIGDSISSSMEVSSKSESIAVDRIDEALKSLSEAILKVANAVKSKIQLDKKA